MRFLIGNIRCYLAINPSFQNSEGTESIPSQTRIQLSKNSENLPFTYPLFLKTILNTTFTLCNAYERSWLRPKKVLFGFRFTQEREQRTLCHQSSSRHFCLVGLPAVVYTTEQELFPLACKMTAQVRVGRCGATLAQKPHIPDWNYYLS